MIISCQAKTSRGASPQAKGNGRPGHRRPSSGLVLEMRRQLADSWKMRWRPSISAGVVQVSPFVLLFICDPDANPAWANLQELLGILKDPEPFLALWFGSLVQLRSRSPGAAEAQAAVSGANLMYHARFHWGEMVSKDVNIYDVDSVVKGIPGCLISDTRNMYDKLQSTELTIKGAERKSDLTLLCVKHSQHVTNLQVRWVHSEAQLGNSLTEGRTKLT